jgi:hypothetical protein
MSTEPASHILKNNKAQKMGYFVIYLSNSYKIYTIGGYLIVPRKLGKITSCTITNNCKNFEGMLVH